MPAAAGEVSRGPLGDRGDDAPTIPTPGDGMEAPLESLEHEITRATMWLQIEPWRLAEDPDAHRSRTCAGKAGCSSCALISVLYKAQQDCAAVANRIARHHWLTDGEVLDKVRAKNAGEDPRWKDVEFEKTYGYPLTAPWAESLQGGIRSALAKSVDDKWRRERWSVLVRHEHGFAGYRETLPIPLRAADVRLIETETRDLFELHCSISPGRHVGGKQFKIPLRAKDPRQYAYLRAIARGEWKQGEVKISRDRRNRWGVRISYKRRVPVIKDTGVAMGINRGIINFLALATNAGEDHLHAGHEIEAKLREYTARRHQRQRAYALSGRRGRGRKKALAPIEPLQAKGSRWRQTRIQTIAKEALKWAQARNVTRVYIEDFTGIRDTTLELDPGTKPIWERVQSWPYYQLQSALVSVFEQAGITEVHVVSATNISRRCPQCEHVHDEPKINRVFVCAKCGHKQHVDVVAALNVITKGEQLRADGKLGVKTHAKTPAKERNAGAARKPQRKASKSNGAGGKGRKRE